MENKTIYFDTQKEDAISHGAVNYLLWIPDRKIQAHISLHLAGEITYHVVEEEKYAAVMSGEGAEKKLVSLFCVCLQAALSEMSETLGMPENLPEKTDEISRAMEERYLAGWHHAFGTALDRFTITTCEPDPKDAQFLASLKESLDFSRRMETSPDEVMKELAQKLEEAQKAAQEAWDKMSPEEQEAAKKAAEQKIKESQEERERLLAKAEELQKRVLNGAPVAKEPSPVIFKTRSWICRCGQENTGNFCTRCGTKREWTCRCGKVNAGNFCTACGKKRGE